MSSLILLFISVSRICVCVRDSQVQYKKSSLQGRPPLLATPCVNVIKYWNSGRQCEMWDVRYTETLLRQTTRPIDHPNDLGIIQCPQCTMHFEVIMQWKMCPFSDGNRLFPCAVSMHWTSGFSCVKIERQFSENTELTFDPSMLVLETLKQTMALPTLPPARQRAIFKLLWGQSEAESDWTAPCAPLQRLQPLKAWENILFQEPTWVRGFGIHQFHHTAPPHSRWNIVFFLVPRSFVHANLFNERLISNYVHAVTSNSFINS